MSKTWLEEQMENPEFRRAFEAERARLEEESRVPEGYHPIAVRDDRQGKCVISYSIARKQFYISTNDVAAGPFNEKDLRQLMENIKDVLSMKGSFHYIEGY